MRPSQFMQLHPLIIGGGVSLLIVCAAPFLFMYINAQDRAYAEARRAETLKDMQAWRLETNACYLPDGTKLDMTGSEEFLLFRFRDALRYDTRLIATYTGRDNLDCMVAWRPK